MIGDKEFVGEIFILGDIFKVYKQEGLISLNNDCGIIQFSSSTILLDSGLSPTKQQQVLMHEIVHAIEQKLCIELSESDVDKMATGIVSIMTDDRNSEYFKLSLTNI